MTLLCFLHSQTFCCSAVRSAGQLEPFLPSSTSSQRLQSGHARHVGGSPQNLAAWCHFFRCSLPTERFCGSFGVAVGLVVLGRVITQPGLLSEMGEGIVCVYVGLHGSMHVVCRPLWQHLHFTIYSSVLYCSHDWCLVAGHNPQHHVH